MFLSGWLPANLVFLLDMLFPVLLSLFLGREIIGGRSRRNYPLVAIILVMAFLNVLFHLGAQQVYPGGDRLAIYLLIHTLLVLVTIIATRIVPSFTGNWLRQQGENKLPVGYILLGCSVFGWIFRPSAALHALTMGAIGSIVLAVTTRVALGHTGRPLHAARLTVLAYWILLLAVVVRILGPLNTNNYMLMIDLSALGWMLAFGLFTWVYWPILSRAKTG